MSFGIALNMVHNLLIKLKKIIFISILLIQFQNTKACDVCGCSIGNGFSTILPQFHKNFVGWRTSYTRFTTINNHLNGELNKESRFSNELWARIYLQKKLQLILTLPYQIKSQTESGSNTNVSGLGDASALINFTIFNQNHDTTKWKQICLIGGGVKLPTGSYTSKKNEVVLPIGLQAGNGALDYLLNFQYTIRHNRLGMSNELQYRLNGINKNQYKMGNQLIGGMRLFYWKKMGPSSNLLPTIGVIYEKMRKDSKDGFTQTETGGYQSSMLIGVDFYWKNWLFGVNLQEPFKQNLNNQQTQSHTKFQINSIYLF